MNTAKRAEQINETGILHASINDDDSLTVYADYYDGREMDLAHLFQDGRFKGVKLELEALQDTDLLCLSEAAQIEDLNLKGNKMLTGLVLSSLPHTIGLRSLDVANTQIGDEDLDTITSFPLLTIVWGHKDQFSAVKLIDLRRQFPMLEFRLIY